jgi:predicted CDP-diglyceride synthetase/phosphatidate cytidylyltransferase
VLNIPTDVLFTSTNSWLTTFAPIAAIGIGITIALAVLGYLGKMIVSAFRR